MSSNNIPTQLPKLTSENWDRWNIQMQAIFGFQEVLEVIQDGYAVVGDEGTEAQRTLYRANKKKDCKAIYLIHQSVDEVNFDKISACATAKQAWDTLERCHTGGMKVKKVKLQALRKQYEHTEMEDDEKIEDFFNKVKVITNSMKLNGETISDEQFCEKILRSLPPRFDFIVCTIEETKDLSTMTPAELLSTLQARELRFSERNGDKKSDQALYASSKKSHGGGKKQWGKNKGKDNQDHHKTQSSDKAESSSKGGGGGNHYKHSGQKFNKKNIKCYNCDKVGHFASECWFAKDHNLKGKKKHDSDACAAQEESSSDSDGNEVKLMMATLSEVSDDHSHTDYWFLDTGCSNHMTSHKEWLIDINPSKKSKIRFADDRTLQAEGMGKMVITRDDGKNVIMEDVLYVPGSNDSDIAKFKRTMHSEFDMTDMGKLSYFLGLQFDETAQGILLHQKKYVKELLLKFNMLGCNPAVTPIEVNSRLELDDTGENVNSTLYRQMVGSLRYLCNSRPDLSFAVGAVSRFVESPKQSHMVAVKRILRYVQGTMEFGVLFPNNISNSVNRLEGFSDSDWCGDHVDRRSTTGYIFKFLHAPISWCSKKQPVIALSSCEAEYIACAFAACQGIWLESLLKDIQVELTEPIQLLVDNKSAINLAKNPISHGRSKHIETRFHFIREQVNNGRIVLNHCPTEVQEADILTKGLKHDRFIKLRSKIGVTTLENTLN
ncbi:hypothetical protein TSUD_365320 [Trifolium subterraneum]|uniref:CCHC-type domain-containing protein n=1 Tax=Trifolium subterraneum TaxID=3900 RepID=A0A2Z6N1M0_TRISU|nr:hypothetical protein TSUD_365320 [Trifolium subterraneum]